MFAGCGERREEEFERRAREYLEREAAKKANELAEAKAAREKALREATIAAEKEMKNL